VLLCHLLCHFCSPELRNSSRSRTVADQARSSAATPQRSNDTASIQTKCRLSLRSAVILLTNCPALPESGQNAPLNWCDGTARLRGPLEAGFFQAQAEMLRLYRLIATMDASAPLPAFADQAPAWDSASNLTRSWGLKHLADRLDEKV
jgi:hypothetical protein